MNYNNKTKDELIKKLRELHLEFDSLKTSFEKDIIERKQAEKVIRKLSMRQEAILETVPEIIMEVDENKIYTWANRSGLEFFGKDVIGKEASFYFEGEQETYSLVQSLFDGSKDFFYLESWQRRCDGKKRLLGWWCQVLIDEQDKVTGVLSSARDITENKLAEEMMKASEEKYRMIFNEVPIGIAISTIEGNIIEVNKAQAEMIGYTVEELKGKSVNEYYVYPDIRMEMIELFKKTGKVRDFEMELEKKDGSIIVELMNIDQIKIESKDYLFATGRNITERKQAEETLRLEKVNFRHSLDDSPLGVRIATIEGNTIYANKALLNFYGYDSLEELQKTPLKKRYTSESYAEAQKRKHQRERSDLNATDYEISINRKNGEIHHLQVFRKEVLWDGLRQFQIIYNDITERLQAEDEIRKSKKLLEDLNKHLNETRENERASISREIHDQIGQSLTALKLDLNQMHKYINSNPEAETKLESMVGLISGTIKDVQRISSDLRPGILDELGLVSAIEWYCDEFEKRTGIKCNLKFDDSDYSDSQINLTFFRVLQETLTNVIRHAKASDVKVTLHKTLKGTILVIKDNGIGIPGDKIDSNQSLGLISMRERVRQFKGTIDIISKQGKGTKLTFFIPL